MTLDREQLVIRSATGEDAGELCRLIDQLGYEQTGAGMSACLNAYDSQGSVVLVAEIEGRVIGFISLHAIPLFHTPDNLGRITAMCVASGYRRVGVGGELLRALEKEANRMGCSRIEVSSGDRRESDAHLFYQKHGYGLESRRFIKHLSSGPTD